MMTLSSRPGLFALTGLLLAAVPAVASSQAKQTQQAQPSPPPQQAPPPQHASPPSPPPQHSAPPAPTQQATARPAPATTSAPVREATPTRVAGRDSGVVPSPVHSADREDRPNRGGQATARGGQGTGTRAVTRGETRGRASETSGGSEERVASRERPRGARPAYGVAVPRQGAPRTHGGFGGGSGYYPGYFPWYYPYSFGLAWDPFWWGGYPDPGYGYSGYGYPGYGGGSTTSDYGYGALKLKVKPNDAQVYVDGYFSGLVDDYDGMFQKLNLEAGPHHIEIRAEGYEPLAFDVRIEYDDTTTYRGEMLKIK